MSRSRQRADHVGTYCAGYGQATAVSHHNVEIAGILLIALYSMWAATNRLTPLRRPPATLGEAALSVLDTTPAVSAVEAGVGNRIASPVPGGLLVEEEVGLVGLPLGDTEDGAMQIMHRNIRCKHCADQHCSYQCTVGINVTTFAGNFPVSTSWPQCGHIGHTQMANFAAVLTIPQTWQTYA